MTNASVTAMNQTVVASPVDAVASVGPSPGVAVMRPGTLVGAPVIAARAVITIAAAASVTTLPTIDAATTKVRRKGCMGVSWWSVVEPWPSAAASFSFVLTRS